jgi:release factor glutamine methyltransferase
VDQRVLIPRPETEVLVGAVLDWCAAAGTAGSVLDMGTGSGAIALSLAQEGGFRRIVASDVSADALDVARANAARLGLAGPHRVPAWPLFDALPADERFDVIVSNPPYVADHERDALMPEVRDHEPAGARCSPAPTASRSSRRS